MLEVSGITHNPYDRAHSWVLIGISLTMHLQSLRKRLIQAGAWGPLARAAQQPAAQVRAVL